MSETMSGRDYSMPAFMHMKRNVLLNPGPSTTTDTVKYAQVVPDICPREKEFASLMKGLREDLVRVVHGDPDVYTSVLFCGSGTINIDVCLNSLLPEGKKALIVNREGKNIYPEEVENMIAADPLVADCVVVGYTTGGVPGEKVGCIVHPDEDVLKVMAKGEEMDWEAVEKLAIAHVHSSCKDLADYKRVRKIVVSKEPLERTSIQKVRRVAYKGKLDE